MTTKTSAIVEASYRVYYGKLFTALLKQFGARYINEIEDAIQNTFYKSLKNWNANTIPEQKENWLYIVAKNDLLNQIKRTVNSKSETEFKTDTSEENLNEDLRLNTILFIAKLSSISSKAKVVFILKNIFGLHIKEIGNCTLLSEDAIYKSVYRTKIELQKHSKNLSFNYSLETISSEELDIVEQILYAVFNIGFDSFDEKIKHIINNDLCLEALALTKMLSNTFEKTSTKNLLALYCLHLSRIPAKVVDNKLISFFDQDTEKWDKDLIKLAFYYLTEPKTPGKYYIEALIVSKHMTSEIKDIKYWNEIIGLYKLLVSITQSPIVKLNLLYCLHKAQKHQEAHQLLSELEKEIPKKHLYFSLVKTQILKSQNNKESTEDLPNILENITQKIRSDYLIEHHIVL